MKRRCRGARNSIIPTIGIQTGKQKFGQRSSENWEMGNERSHQPINLRNHTQSATDKEPWKVMQNSTENFLGLQQGTWDRSGWSATGKMSWIKSTGIWGCAGIFWSVWVCHNHVTPSEINGKMPHFCSANLTQVSFLINSAKTTSKWIFRET